MEQKEVQLNAAISPDTMKELKRFCFEKDIKKKVVVDEALKAYFAKGENK